MRLMYHMPEKVKFASDSGETETYVILKLGSSEIVFRNSLEESIVLE
jgi:hypothetical protein